MKLNRILCPIDYSPFSEAANYYASVFAEGVDAEIIFLNVANAESKEHDEEENLDVAYLKLSTKIRPFVLDIRHDFEVRIGDPAKEIVDVANHRNVDLIVMGTHGRSGVSHMLHGSVCEKVLRNASCPVMAVKSKLDFEWVLTGEERPATVENDPEAKS
jgi:nucleotide-binding universal stress UspA family protein